MKNQKYAIQTIQQRAEENQQQENMKQIKGQIALQQEQNQQMIMFMAKASQTIPGHLDTYALLLLTFLDPSLAQGDKNSEITLNLKFVLQVFC